MSSHESRKRRSGVAISPNEDEINDLVKRRCMEKQEAQELVEQTKVFNDPVHGHFSLPILLFKIIDTPQFQRLRKLKQLGMCYLVFPGASHNRFEHSTGTAYLADRMCRTLQKNQPELGITRIDRLCVQIAGLCHDLGHGPFSHFFDGVFIPKICPNSVWKHEQASVEMFDHMIKENGLRPLFHAVGLQDVDITFIKEMIAGPMANSSAKEWEYIGRGQEKSFLYEIVSNKQTGVDVDKWDYFARDCHHLGISNNFDYRRYMKFARVINFNGRTQICTRDKEVSTLYDMFHTRNSLHRRAYQHKTAKLIEFMLCDVLLKANDYIKLPNKNGELVKISECINDMSAYTLLTDEILLLIEMSRDQNLKQSQELLQRIYTRDLYKFVGQTILQNKVGKADVTEIRNAIIGKVEKRKVDRQVVDPDDFIIHIVTFDYGMKEKNPIDQARFYDKNNPDIPIKVKKNQVSQMLPESFAEQHLRFYYKKNDQGVLTQAKKAFNEWCQEMTVTQSINDAHPELIFSEN